MIGLFTTRGRLPWLIAVSVALLGLGIVGGHELRSRMTIDDVKRAWHVREGYGFGPQAVRLRRRR